LLALGKKLAEGQGKRKRGGKTLSQKPGGKKEKTLKAKPGNRGRGWKNNRGRKTGWPRNDTSNFNRVKCGGGDTIWRWAKKIEEKNGGVTGQRKSKKKGKKRSKNGSAEKDVNYNQGKKEGERQGKTGPAKEWRDGTEKKERTEKQRGPLRIKDSQP